MKHVFQGQPDLHGPRIILLALLLDSFTILTIDGSYSGLVHWLVITDLPDGGAEQHPIGHYSLSELSTYPF